MTKKENDLPGDYGIDLKGLLFELSGGIKYRRSTTGTLLLWHYLFSDDNGIFTSKITRSSEAKFLEEWIIKCNHFRVPEEDTSALVASTDDALRSIFPGVGTFRRLCYLVNCSTGVLHLAPHKDIPSQDVLSLGHGLHDVSITLLANTIAAEEGSTRVDRDLDEKDYRVHWVTDSRLQSLIDLLKDLAALLEKCKGAPPTVAEAILTRGIGSLDGAYKSFLNEIEEHVHLTRNSKVKPFSDVMLRQVRAYFLKAATKKTHEEVGEIVWPEKARRVTDFTKQKRASENAKNTVEDLVFGSWVWDEYELVEDFAQVLFDQPRQPFPTNVSAIKTVYLEFLKNRKSLLDVGR